MRFIYRKKHSLIIPYLLTRFRQPQVADDISFFCLGYFWATNEDWKLGTWSYFSGVVGAMTSEKSGNPGPEMSVEH